MTVERERPPLRDRGVFSLSEAADYAHLGENAARELCHIGIDEVKRLGTTRNGWACWTVGQGQFRITRESVDAWIRHKVEEFAGQEHHEFGTRPPSRRLAAVGGAE